MRCIRAVTALREQEAWPLETLVFYTEADRAAPFVRHADRAVALAAAGVGAYLDGETLIALAVAHGADAVWPGWGFLSEDARFAERTLHAGLNWIGPSPEVIRGVGDKIAAKRLAERCRVPVSPWSAGAVPDAEAALRWAEQIGYPLVVKASAGGGGRGIRVVTQASELRRAFESARAEAKAAFGDDTLFLERMLGTSRHIEVQLAGDAHTNVVVVGCRDCSVQRRHQKVIEEAPPPGLDASLRARIERAALALAESVGYVGVGTAEFLVERGDFYFVELNPRLQVEHGITEELTGVDLVQLQLRIARGDSLAGLAIVERGHAIEARVCAEDPDAGFAPAPGRIARFDPPVGPRVRVDTGVVAGSEVPAAFDSLIAKVIARGDDREEARARLVAALKHMDLVIDRGASNRAHLCEVLESRAFRRAELDTRWLDRFISERPRSPFAGDALAAGAILAARAALERARSQLFGDPSRISSLDVPAFERDVELGAGGVRYGFRVWQRDENLYGVAQDGREIEAKWIDEGGGAAQLRIGTRRQRVLYDVGAASLRVEIGASCHVFARADAGEVRAYAPAVVVALDLAPGDRVEAGQRLGVLEAMKIEFSFGAPVAGTLRELRVRIGQQVAAGDVLAIVEPEAEPAQAGAGAARAERLALPAPEDSLAEWLAGGARPPDAFAALRRELERALLGYDLSAQRQEALLAFLAVSPQDEEARCAAQDFAAPVLTLHADVERLFLRDSQAAAGVAHGSNESALREFVRHPRSAAGEHAGGFRELLDAALAHYGISYDAPQPVLECALFRLLCARAASAARGRLALAVVRHVQAAGGGDAALGDVLLRLASMRTRVGGSLADAALEAHYALFERPVALREARRTSETVERWFAETERQPTLPSRDVLEELAHAPEPAFATLARWVTDPDVRHRSLVLMAQLWRLYGPTPPRFYSWLLHGDVWVDRLDLAHDRVVLGCIASLQDATQRCADLQRIAATVGARDPGVSIEALELLVGLEGDVDRESVVRWIAEALVAPLCARRFTLTLLAPTGIASCHTFESSGPAFRERADLHGLHPTRAARLHLDGLSEFELERLPAPDGVTLLRARGRRDAGDLRLLALAEVRGRLVQDGRPQLHARRPSSTRSTRRARRCARRSRAGTRGDSCAGIASSWWSRARSSPCATSSSGWPRGSRPPRATWASRRW